MKRYAILATSLLLIASAANADHPQKHYEANVPTSYAEALVQAQMATQATQEAAAKGDLPSMHQHSYALEAAIKVMQDELTRIAEQVEIMHQASERNKRAEAQSALADFAPRIQALAK